MAWTNDFHWSCRRCELVMMAAHGTTLFVRPPIDARELRALLDRPSSFVRLLSGVRRPHLGSGTFLPLEWTEPSEHKTE